MLLTTIATLDELLQAHAAQLGADFTAYRNHTYRVVNLGVALSAADPERLEKMAIAAAFHDLGVSRIRRARAAARERDHKELRAFEPS